MRTCATASDTRARRDLLSDALSGYSPARVGGVLFGLLPAALYFALLGCLRGDLVSSRERWDLLRHLAVRAGRRPCAQHDFASARGADRDRASPGGLRTLAYRY